VRSQGIGERLEQLDQSLADGQRGADGAAAPSDRAGLINNLSIARAATEARLEAVVAALEHIRLNLLRLRAGDGAVERITADVAAAMEIAAQTERLLEGRDEMERRLLDR
jgi:hypothetical protein